MNPALLDLGPSLIREINARKQAGCIDLGLGEPVVIPDAAVFHRAADWVAEHGCPYSPLPGFADLRQLVGALHGCEANQVLITHGSQGALYVALRTALDPRHDEVLIVEPAYPAYQKICEMEGIRWRSVSLAPEEGFAPDAQRVLKALRPETRLVIVGSPSNPSGRIWPEAELRALCAGLDGRWLLSDEVYRELYLGDTRPVSACALYERAFVASGLSKSHAVTGLRLGWLVCPPGVSPQATRAHQLMTTSASTYGQRVAVELLGDPHKAEEQRALYRQRRQALLATLAEHGLESITPEGAFYCLVRRPEGRWMSSLELAMELVDHAQVAVIPGLAFGAACDAWLRISWVAEPAVVAEGLQRLSAYLAT